MIVELIDLVFFWLDALTLTLSTTGDLSLRDIITGMKVEYVKRFWLHFGEYALVHEAHYNTMKSRVTGSISLHPTVKIQGEY